MDVLIERCAGLDVHRDTVVATVRCPGPGGTRRSETRTFATMTGGGVGRAGERPAAPEDPGVARSADPPVPPRASRGADRPDARPHLLPGSRDRRDSPA